jgi:hypothetical protein
MAKILAVHGIFHQYDGHECAHKEWFPALSDGLRFAGGNKLAPEDLAIAFYGDLFRKRVTKSISEPRYEAIDVTDPYEQELLAVWSNAVQTIEPELQRETKDIIRMPGSVQFALLTLCRSRCFANVAEHLLIARIKQISGYMNKKDNYFQDVQARVEEAVKPDTKILIGHSLGSVIAYEALCAHPEWPIETFITLGSPLGIPNLFFERLHRPPDYVGVWPGMVKRWTNIADEGDVVALVKQLKPKFGNAVEDVLVYNGILPHIVKPYLTAKETGYAIKAGLEH